MDKGFFALIAIGHRWYRSQGRHPWLAFVLFFFALRVTAMNPHEDCRDQKGWRRSPPCVQWMSMMAINSLQTAPFCQANVHLPLLMCIFQKELGSFQSYEEKGDNEDVYCTHRGCGLSQMTENGVAVVKTALSVPDLKLAWDNYWDQLDVPLVNRKAIHELNRRDAMNTPLGIIMGVMHLCEEVREMDLRSERVSPFELAFRYNGHPQYQDSYAKEVIHCLSFGGWQEKSLAAKKPPRGEGRLSKRAQKGSAPSKKEALKKDDSPFTFYNIPGLGIMKIYKKDLEEIKRRIQAGQAIERSQFEFPH